MKYHQVITQMKRFVQMYYYYYYYLSGLQHQPSSLCKEFSKSVSKKYSANKKVLQNYSEDTK